MNKKEIKNKKCIQFKHAQYCKNAKVMTLDNVKLLNFHSVSRVKLILFYFVLLQTWNLRKML